MYELCEINGTQKFSYLPPESKVSPCDKLQFQSTEMFNILEDFDHNNKDSAIVPDKAAIINEICFFS